MSWFRLDDNGYDHDKVLSAGDRAYGAWCRAGQYASNKKTDGFVSHRAAKQINSDVRVWKRLVEVGLMESAEGGYVIHDYLDYNPSKAELEAKSEARRAAGALGSEARWGKNSERIAIERHQLCDRTDPTLRSKGTNSASGFGASARKHWRRGWQPLWRVPSDAGYSRPVPSRPITYRSDPPCSPPAGDAGAGTRLRPDPARPRPPEVETPPDHQDCPPD